ncbi:hypothetical protein FM112_01400 [Gulosibacter sp. 10]|nr:hypothetical protein FM112_01400 [Gulosibacter sp. 10]
MPGHSTSLAFYGAHSRTGSPSVEVRYPATLTGRSGKVRRASPLPGRRSAPRP